MDATTQGAGDLIQETLDDLTERLAEPMSKGFRKTVESIVVEQLLDVDSDLSHALSVAFERHDKKDIDKSLQSSHSSL